MAAATRWWQFETVLLDMDGTILDLAYDSYFWRELVPRCLARQRGQTQAEVTAGLFEQYASKQGTLDWYCLDYWAGQLDLDLRELKSASSHRIRFLPGATGFLDQLRDSGRRVVLVTNAHRYTLEVKKGVAGLERWIETYVSSHDFGTPKESREFWTALTEALNLDPASTLFVDDSGPVLDAAADFGLGGVLAVTRPDSRGPERPARRHPAVAAIGDLSRPA